MKISQQSVIVSRWLLAPRKEIGGKEIGAGSCSSDCTCLLCMGEDADTPAWAGMNLSLCNALLLLRTTSSVENDFIRVLQSIMRCRVRTESRSLSLNWKRTSLQTTGSEQHALQQLAELQAVRVVRLQAAPLAVSATGL